MKEYITMAMFCSIAMVSCISSRHKHYHFNQKTAPPQLRADLLLAQKILAANHPSLYWYTSKDSVQYYFQQTLASINDSLTEVEFRNKVAIYLAQIRCGHTVVRFSKNFNSLIEKNRFPLFPFQIKTWGDSMVVVNSMLPNDSIFKRGTIITSINHHSNRQLLDSMFKPISVDGFNHTYESQLVSGNFPVWYRLAWGVDSSFTITYVSKEGQEKSTVVRAYMPTPDSVAKAIQRSKDSSIKKEKTIRENFWARRQNALIRKRSLAIDTLNQTATMRISTFAEGHLRRFFRRSFKKTHHLGTENLIIDLRENTGGYLSNSNLLTKYLIDHPFKNGDSIYARTLSVRHPYYVKESLKYWLCSHVISRKNKEDGLYHYRRGERHFFKPKRKHHFNGNIYILQGGYTFSAASLVSGALKGQANVTIVGEESGGGYYGNTAMFLPTIILPNTKLRIVMPMYRMVVDAKRTKDGHGVQPDLPVFPSSNIILQGIDPKMEATKALIIQKKKAAALPEHH